MLRQKSRTEWSSWEGRLPGLPLSSLIAIVTCGSTTPFQEFNTIRVALGFKDDNAPVSLTAHWLLPHILPYTEPLAWEGSNAKQKLMPTCWHSSKLSLLMCSLVFITFITFHICHLMLSTTDQKMMVFIISNISCDIILSVCWVCGD